MSHVLGRRENTLRIDDSVTQNHLLNLVAEHILHQLGPRFELSVQLLKLFLLIFVAQIESSFVVDFIFFPSNSFSCCTAYSSTESTR